MADTTANMDEAEQEGAETPQARVLAFLANLRPDPHTVEMTEHTEDGRARLMEWMVASECGQDVQWSARDCANILHFLSMVVPARCYCNDSHPDGEAIRRDLTCGYHEVLSMLEDQVGHLGQREAHQ